MPVRARPRAHHHGSRPPFPGTVEQREQLATDWVDTDREHHLVDPGQPEVASLDDRHGADTDVEAERRDHELDERRSERIEDHAERRGGRLRWQHSSHRANVLP